MCVPLLFDQSCSILIKSFTHTTAAQNAQVATSSLTSTVDRLAHQLLHLARQLLDLARQLLDLAHQLLDIMQVNISPSLATDILDKSVSSCRTDLLDVNGQNLPSTILLQVVSTSCN